MIVIIDALLLVLAAILTAAVPRIVAMRRARAASRAAVEIAKRGLTAGGDLLGAHWAHGQVDGVDVDIVNDASQRLHGASGLAGTTACIVRVRVSLPDQIVCALSRVDQVLGPTPVVPRTQTGYDAFDDAYAVFVAPQGTASGTSYRTPPGTAGIPWAREPVLESLLELRLVSLRIQDGSAEIAFPPMETEDLVRAAATAAAIERAACGTALPRLARGPRRLKPTFHLPDLRLAWAGLLAGVLGVPVAFLGPVRALESERWCGPGDWIAAVPVGDGWSLACAQHPGDSLVGYVAGLMLALGLAVVVAFLAVLCWQAATELPRGS